VKKPVPFGKYYLLERINVGGMAEVFRAKAYGVEGFERLVAVKRILPNIAEDKDFIRMFIDEAKIAVQLNHANIAQIFDLGVVDNSYYIALEHVHGRDVRAIFDRSRTLGEPMPIAQACFIIMKICEGLDYAHNKRDQSGRDLNLVHRDVSPQNILTSFEGEVKLIDFGIAKAAGKGAKTQAGILKGKFGYMSPEQVRGLPIDRRTDIFSCGIVLYELLTGERLFVGESDFSTLEKVRNVEILPPSTYNRKIPDELERIVLKALAKDVEDRYQNSIDLHDELQAFVYTAGEFYSRKDLAAWMKRTFTKEIEEETAKLESYRQLKPPPELAAASNHQQGGQGKTPAPTFEGGRPGPTRPPAVPPGVRRTQSMPSVPPPQPGAGGPPMLAQRPPPPPGRVTQGMPVVPPPANTPAPMFGAPVPAAASMGPPKADLNWDDDELETQIYDNPEEEAAARARQQQANGGMAAPAPMAAAGLGPAPLGAPPAMSPVAMAAAAAAAPSDEADLSSLVRTSKGWGAAVQPGGGQGGPLPGVTPSSPDYRAAPGAPTMLGQTAPGFGPGQGPTNGSNGHGHGLATGSNKLPSPFPSFGEEARESSAVASLAARDSSYDPAFDPMASFGQGLTPPRKSKALLWAALGGVVLIGAAVAVVVMTSGSGSSGNKSQAAEGGTPGSSATAPGTGAEAAVAGGSAATTAVAGQGEVKLTVKPAGSTGWRFDGQPQTTTLRTPVLVKTTPGKHQVAIDAPPGFMSVTQDVEVVVGQTIEVTIELQAIDIVASFESAPPGATVSLLVSGKRIEVGPTPTQYKIDPRERYDVVFEKDGYVSETRPLVLSGSPEEKVVVNLERAQVASIKSGGGDRGGGGSRGGGGGGSDRSGGGSAGDKTSGGGSAGDKTSGGGTGDKTSGGGTGDKTSGGGDTGDKASGGGGGATTGGGATGGGGGGGGAAAKGEGTLSLGAKPPCEIFIDGRNTGLKTPQREIKLPAGKHRITLLNNEFGIKESFAVDIKANDTVKMVKDFSDRLPQ